MKNLFFLLLLAMPLVTTAQHIPKNADPLFLIDSVAMNTPQLKCIEQFIDPNAIKNVYVAKNARYPNGAVYVTLKDSTLLPKILKDKFLTLNDIAQNNVPQTQRKLKPVYLLDDKLITDTTEIFIPATFVKQVQVLKAEDAPYFQKSFPNAVIIKISTKDPVLHIRGIAE